MFIALPLTNILQQCLCVMQNGREYFKYFKENRGAIIKEQLNEFVVIKNAKILGYYKTGARGFTGNGKTK